MNPKDPRLTMPNHKERSYKAFTYTYEDLAKLFHVEVQTIRNWVSKGKLNPTDIQSVIELYLLTR